VTEASNDRLGHHFWVRRLHSLTGIVPVGVFLCIHLTINWTVIFGPDKFQNAVHGVHALGLIGLLYVVEIVGIFIPIAFHAILGVQIWLTGRQNMMQYRYGASIRYALQRWSGVVALVFILGHLWHMHWVGKPFGGGFFEPHDAPLSAAAALQELWWYAPLYAFGLLCVVFHFCNGIWTFLITWGITISREGQRRVGYACLALGVVLSLMGLSSLFVLRTMDLTPESRQPVHVAMAVPESAE
jgi:succinate dehydrogenase / fumarate reductase cytochrome b subunit